MNLRCRNCGHDASAHHGAHQPSAASVAPFTCGECDLCYPDLGRPSDGPNCPPAVSPEICDLPDPQIGWMHCTRPPGHDGMHRATFTREYIVPAPHQETFVVAWLLADIDPNPEDPPS